MQINVLHLLEGAKAATGLTVIIDVFRAFTVQAYIMNNGAERIIPVADKQLAYDLKAKDDSYILVGERFGKMLPGFNYNNSPYQVHTADFSGKTVVHTTSAGTQGLHGAVNASEIITGSFVNAKAIAKYIKLKKPKVVSLVSMGLNGVEQTAEDNLCSSYIKSLLIDDELDISDQLADLKNTTGAKFFKPELQDRFSPQDYYLCTELNKFNFVLKLQKGTDPNTVDYMEKIEV